MTHYDGFISRVQLLINILDQSLTDKEYDEMFQEFKLLLSLDSIGPKEK